jgi:hypothetical protein
MAAKVAEAVVVYATHRPPTDRIRLVAMVETVAFLAVEAEGAAQRQPQQRVPRRRLLEQVATAQTPW